jgi:CBS domain-containing protein
MSAPTAGLAATASAESPPVAAAEAEASAPLRVGDIETVVRLRLLTAAADTMLVEVAAMLSKAEVGVVVVCDDAGRPLGTITETVLVKRLGLGQAGFFTTAAREVMTRRLDACGPDDLLSDVLAQMHDSGRVQLLVIDSSHRLVGVLNARDGLRALLAAGNQAQALLRNYVMGIGYQ